jgi:hypothetical protein
MKVRGCLRERMSEVQEGKRMKGTKNCLVKICGRQKKTMLELKYGTPREGPLCKNFIVYSLIFCTTSGFMKSKSDASC